MSDYISRNQLISIREFLENYCCLKCTWKGKLTHKRMKEFLTLRGKSITKGKIGEITKEEKLKGEYLYVKDETGQVIPYKNPSLSFRRLQVSLFLNQNKQKLEQIRLSLLKEQELIYDEFGKVITIDEYKERQNKLIDEEYDFYERMFERKSKVKKHYISRRR